MPPWYPTLQCTCLITIKCQQYMVYKKYCCNTYCDRFSNLLVLVVIKNISTYVNQLILIVIIYLWLFQNFNILQQHIRSFIKSNITNPHYWHIWQNPYRCVVRKWGQHVCNQLISRNCHFSALLGNIILLASYKNRLKCEQRCQSGQVTWESRKETRRKKK